MRANQQLEGLREEEDGGGQMQFTSRVTRGSHKKGPACITSKELFCINMNRGHILIAVGGGLQTLNPNYCREIFK